MKVCVGICVFWPCDPKVCVCVFGLTYNQCRTRYPTILSVLSIVEPRSAFLLRDSPPSPLSKRGSPVEMNEGAACFHTVLLSV